MPSFSTSASSTSNGICRATFGLSCRRTIRKVCTFPSVVQYQKNSWPPMTPVQNSLHKGVCGLAFLSLAVLESFRKQPFAVLCCYYRKWPRAEGKWSRSSLSKSSLVRHWLSSPKTACISTSRLRNSAEFIDIVPQKWTTFFCEGLAVCRKTYFPKNQHGWKVLFRVLSVRMQGRTLKKYVLRRWINFH